MATLPGSGGWGPNGGRPTTPGTTTGSTGGSKNWWDIYGPDGDGSYGSSVGTGTGGGGGMDAGQQSAFATLSALLAEYGLSSLEGFLKDLILDGITDAATITLRLQGTAEWKARFAGNEMLRANGLGVLSAQEYLAVERSYAQVMKNYGLPEGFYDDPSDFAQWIGNNVSAAELQQRVSSYADLAKRDDADMKAQLQSMGFGDGDLLAYMMDPTRAMPLLQQKLETAKLGTAARKAGVVADNEYLGSLAARGVTEQQASQGYGLIAQSLDDAENLSAIHRENYGLDDMQAEIFENDGDAANKRKRLASRERAAFTGQTGIGNLGRNSAGSY